MRKLFFLFSLILLTSISPAFARIDYRKLMLDADFNQVIKSFKKESNLKNLFEDEAVIFIHTLVMEGKIQEAEEYASYYRERFPKNTEIRDSLREIKLFAMKYDFEDFSSNQKALITLSKQDLSGIKNKKAFLDSILSLENEFYFRPKYNFAFLLGNEFHGEIERSCLKEIKAKQDILFPKTRDFYDLAMAYKALAIIKIQEGKLKEAKRFIVYARTQIEKMRTIWLIEDLHIYKPILKITTKETSFGSLFPQYLIQLREEFASFLL